MMHFSLSFNFISRAFFLLKLLVSITVSFTVTGCVTTALNGPTGSLPKAVSLEFHGRAGETSETRYFSNARILTYEDQQLVRDRTEGVDFTVASHCSDYNPTSRVLKYEAKTTHKDGTVDLHDLAFPELQEEIDYVVRSNGEVLKAGRFPPQSLFFVPSLPIPAKPVEVGDTWSMEHSWYSARDAIPMRLQVIGILKDIVHCEGDKVCADLEISGGVALAASPVAKGSQFKSRLWGRVLFSLARGDVLWSEVRSMEDMGVQGDKMSVRSCMLSEMKLSGDYKTKFSCEPREDAVGPTPKL